MLTLTLLKLNTKTNFTKQYCAHLNLSNRSQAARGWLFLTQLFTFLGTCTNCVSTLEGSAWYSPAMSLSCPSAGGSLIAETCTEMSPVDVPGAPPPLNSFHVPTWWTWPCGRWLEPQRCRSLWRGPDLALDVVMSVVCSCKLLAGQGFL